MMDNTEKRIIARLIPTLAEVGWTVDGFNDGCEFVRTVTMQEVFEAVESVGVGTLAFVKASKPGRRLGVYLVLGNGEDVISDYHCPEDCPEFVQAIESVET